MKKIVDTVDKQQLAIEFLYADLTVCTRCRETDRNLEEAISEVAKIVRATGVDVMVKKIHVQSEEQAQTLGFVSSPTIRINGKDIQFELKESPCDSCGDLCGENVLCRVWTYQGKEYTAAPKPMIIEAILKKVYGGEDRTPKASKGGKVPDNLKRFFAAKHRKETPEDRSRQSSLPGRKCC
jgi:hypothetical protein